MALYPRITLFSVLLLAAAGAQNAHADPYPPSMINAFNQNCAKDPKLAAFCTCMMDDIQKTIPLADFIEIGNKPGGINSDPRFQAAAKDCIARVPPAAATPAPTGKSQ